jgi:predicted protein tyrosine phosphatase
MPQVDVYNREGACSLDPIEGTVIISISGPTGTPAPLKEGWEDVLRLEFDDVVKPVAGIPDLVLFHQGHVDKVQAFVEKHVEAGKDFVVHCDAGISRSVAIGMYINEVYEGDLNLHAIHTTAAANARVHRGLIRKHWAERFNNE